ncbi:efflux RND transporter periplasmic adaptor subunit [Fischerella thermalis CCMEE 5273]|uniref:Cation efflux system protein CzcB n=1 Tax=Chlorogloeopsis fritschii PCC 6912 TaxID=211165 RepID=A0A3S0ZZ72_CHLFR|nr:efflux RND transporter periplasmic adaptor subunit [Chlorogloeopsis fritschii]PMB09474.1 efflux RND transporter periplasmic adaptor subunit [Fischerella thermalis CCMEE 5273]RUR83732.1 cation efflux system protein CzcB [Chlorogloeopsis fritschii PCC 6912]
MVISKRYQPSIPLRCTSSIVLSLLLLSAPTSVFAGGGHDHSGGSAFQSGSETSGSIEVDAETAQQLGIRVEPVKRQPLALGIKATGQIETLPSQRVEVTTPISGAKVVELLVEPGARVQKGQPVAVLTSPDLVSLRVESQEKLAQGQADLQQALADLRLAQQNYDRYQQIATAEIAQTQSQVAFAQEKYDKDKQLADAGALPRRNALESQTQLAEAKAKLVTASSRRDVIEAENQLKRAQAAVKVAQSRINLSNTTYQTRLSQLGALANAKGLVTVTSPLDGKVADREVTIGQSFQDAGGKLMTILNDSRIFATANIYEKDLNKVKRGQPLRVKISSLPNRIFTGKITRIGSVVEGETRVVPVQAEIENSGGQLKPGMFAELQVLTNETSAPVLAIPSSAVVDANGKKMIYVKNGNAFQSVDVSVGQTSGDLVEITSGLFEGDLVVTQRAPQLYAQSLRGDNKAKEEEHNEEGGSHTTEAKTNSLPIPLWLLGAGGGVAIATLAFLAGSFWSSRRARSRQVPVGDGFNYETEVYIDNHKQPTPSTSNTSVEEQENYRRSDSN